MIVRSLLMSVLVVGLFGSRAEASGYISFSTQSVATAGSGFEIANGGREEPDSPPFYYLEIPHFTNAIQAALNFPTLVEMQLTLNVDFVAGYGYLYGPADIPTDLLQSYEPLTAELGVGGPESSVTVSLPGTHEVSVQNPQSDFQAVVSINLIGAALQDFEYANAPLADKGEENSDYFLVPSPYYDPSADITKGIFLPSDHEVYDRSGIENVAATVTYTFVPEPSALGLLLASGPALLPILRRRLRSPQNTDSE